MYDYDWWMAWRDFLIPVGFITLGFFFNAYLTRQNAVAAAKRGKVILADAEKEAEMIRKTAENDARNELLTIREKAEEEAQKQRKDLVQLEERIIRREQDFDRKLTLLDKKESEIGAEKDRLLEKQDEVRQEREKLRATIGQQYAQLEKISGLSREAASKELIARLEKELEKDSSRLIRHMQNESRMNAEEKSKRIIAMAAERYAGEYIGSITTTVVHLPEEQIKARLIGKEGRNIRAFEHITGVNMLIDEAPDSVLLSSFDPVRREIAAEVVKQLCKDRRVYPERIEELYNKYTVEVEELTRKFGEEALFELGIQGVAPELMSLLGKLKFRTSFSQNVLQHSVECAHFMGMMAAELDLDVSIAKRVGIFHDIGKAIDHEVEGNHTAIGVRLLRKYGEDPIIVNACASHHHDVEQKSIYDVLASAADAMTAARPGARTGSTDFYIKRLEKLEQIAARHKGVEKGFAMQAGRELRIIVEPKKIDDNQAMLLAREIAREIESEVKYPGQIKVSVIRETRCIEYAQ